MRTMPADVGQPGPSTTGALELSLAALSTSSEEGKMDVVRQAPVSRWGTDRPRRPDRGGTRGTVVTVLANHFVVQQKGVELYHYDVALTPERVMVSRARCREIFSAMLQQHAHRFGGRRPVYDGQKNIYTAGPLPFRQEEFRVETDGGQPAARATEDPARPARDRSVKVVITEVETKPVLHALFEALRGNLADMPYNVLQALDCVVRESLMARYVPVGRSFFSATVGRSNLGFGVEAWKGFYQSIRPTQQGLALVVDKSCTSFVQAMPVPEYVKNVLGRADLNRPLTDADRQKVKKALVGLRVECTHRGPMRMKFTITGITHRPLRKITFPLEENGESRTLSITDYFQQRYNYQCRLLQMPCLEKGRGDNPALFPMEVCTIVEGQHYKKKLNDKQVTEMLRITCTRPEQRRTEIGQTVQMNNYNADPYTQEFGMQINPTMTSVQARVLEPPKLQYRGGGPFVPDAGAWNIRGKVLLECLKINRWTVINFTRLDMGAINMFMGNFMNIARQSGLDFNQRPAANFRPGNWQDPGEALWGVCREATGGQRPPEGVAALDLIFCILPDRDNAGLYGNIKKICETEIGVVTQCLLQKNILKGSPQYCANVALKVNVKTGGRNTALVDALQMRLPIAAQQGVPTIVFGADVTHGATNDTSPSVAAVVANMDWPHMTKYRCMMSTQKSNQEIIENLYVPAPGAGEGTGMIRDLLLAYYRATKVKPARILFYRDGVSEGQFDAVRIHEIAAIKNACFSLSETYDPPLTFVVVQKRHHTRLFPTDNRNADRSGNIKPGTVVDTKICHPSEFDFYLCSHAGIQGTSKPTHYHVLFDQNGFTSDSLQGLTYAMCYTYARCTRSVSIVPPAYYAHLAAFRAKYYVGEASESGSLTSATGQVQAGQQLGTFESSGSSRSRPAQEASVVPPLPTVHESVRKVMFYC